MHRMQRFSTADRPSVVALAAAIEKAGPATIDSGRSVQYKCQGFRKYLLSEPHAAPSYELGISLPAVEELLNSSPRVSRHKMIAFPPGGVVPAMGFVTMSGAVFLCGKPTAEVKK